MELDTREVMDGILSQIGFGSSEEAAGTIVKNVDLARQKYTANETKQSEPTIAPTTYTKEINGVLGKFSMKDVLIYGGGTILGLLLLSKLLKGK